MYILDQLIELRRQVKTTGVLFKHCLELERLLDQTYIDHDALKNCNDLGVSESFVFTHTLNSAIEELHQNDLF
jgi:hypothetical protein